MEDIRIVTSRKGLRFMIQQYQNYVYIGLENYTPSWVGQVHVYEAVKHLGLENNGKFFVLGGVNSIVFKMGNHSISEIEDALKSYTKY